MNRDQAWALLNEFTASEALVRHGIAVEAAMRWYADHFSEDENLWGVVGLIHDFDYEQNPEPPSHTQVGGQILRERGIDEEIVTAMMSHAEWNQVDYPLDRPLRRTLFAVDELCGFLHACALVRPERLEGMTPKSVKKKMKTKSFAASVSRDDIIRGAELLDISLDDHIRNCVEALKPVSSQIGLSE